MLMRFIQVHCFLLLVGSPNLRKMYINSHLWVLVVCSYCVVSNGYIYEHLEDKLCVPGSKNAQILLLDGSDSAAIITQRWNSTWLSSSESSKNINYDCTFNVTSSGDTYRIPRATYTAITRLRFRKNHRTGECLDYIQFSGDGNPPSERICGNTLIDGPINMYPLMHDLTAINSVVTIHIDNSIRIMAPLELRIVFTAHSQCSHREDFLCEPDVLYSCISRDFVRDNITNCVAPCRDESSCFQENAKITDLEKDKIIEKVSEIEFDTLPIADDNSTSCITVNFLEEKLKEYTEVLRKSMKENGDSLLSRMDDIISDKETDRSLPIYGATEADVSQDSSCVTVKLFEMKFKEYTEFLFDAIKAGVDRVTDRLDEYENNLSKLNARVENLEPRGNYRTRPEY